MLKNRERLEHLRVIDNQPEYKFYLRPKTILLNLPIIAAGIAIWIFRSNILSAQIIPVFIYLFVSQGIFCRTEHARLREKLDAVREMNELEKTIEANVQRLREETLAE